MNVYMDVDVGVDTLMDVDVDFDSENDALHRQNEVDMGDIVEVTSSCSVRACHLPNETLAQIVSNFVPRGGLCVSNHPDYHSDLATIGSLLRVSKTIRDEVLHRMFSQPLQVYILSGAHCRCLFGTKPFLQTRLGTAAALPLSRFPEVVVTFAPQLLKALCGHRSQTPWSVDSLRGERGVRKFRNEMRCIMRQSQALSEEMIRHPDVKAQDAPFFRFRFDGTKGVDEVNRVREIPLWEVSVLEWPLDTWRLVCTPWFFCNSLAYQIDLPEKVVTGILTVWKFDQGYLVSRNPLDECSYAVARCWRGLWQGFQTDPSWHIQRSSYQANSINLRFIITTRRERGAVCAERPLEVEYFVQEKPI